MTSEQHLMKQLYNAGYKFTCTETPMSNTDYDYELEINVYVEEKVYSFNSIGNYLISSNPRDDAYEKLDSMIVSELFNIINKK